MPHNASMSKKLAKAAGIVPVMVLALVLAGCDQFVADPLSYTVVDSTGVVRACLPMTVTSITVTTFSGTEGDSGEVVWAATGEASLDSGAEFAIGAPLDGLTVTLDEGQPVLSETLSFDMEVVSERGDPRQTHGYFDAGALTSGVWLDGYGQPLDVPCTHEPCKPGWTCLNDWNEPSGRELDPLPTFSPTVAPIVD